LNPEEQDAVNADKAEAKKAAEQIQKDASSAKKDVEDAEVNAEQAKVDKDSTVAIKVGEKEIEAKKEIKAKKIAE